MQCNYISFQFVVLDHIVLQIFRKITISVGLFIFFS